jgi:hypothetical protein
VAKIDSGKRDPGGGGVPERSPRIFRATDINVTIQATCISSTGALAHELCLAETPHGANRYIARQTVTSFSTLGQIAWAVAPVRQSITILRDEKTRRGVSMYSYV